MSENKQNMIESMQDKFGDLPMLRSLLKSFINDLQFSLRRDYNMPIEILHDMIIPLSMSDYTKDNHVMKDSLVVEYLFDGWNVSHFYMLFSKRSIYKILEFILGGDKIDYQFEIVDRPFSNIEKEIISHFLEVASKCMQDAFLLVSNNIKILVSKIYFDNNFVLPNEGVVILSKSNIRLKNLDGLLDVIIPYDALTPIKTKLLKSFSNLKLKQIDEWKKHLQKFVSDMEMSVTVEIEVPQTFNNTHKMNIGDTIITGMDESELFKMKINGKKIYNCKIGKISENIAVEITGSDL